MNQLQHHIDAMTGHGQLPQDIADAALEITLAETDTELLAAAKRYQNFVLIAARGRQMKNTRNISIRRSLIQAGVLA